jgi:hypothetical protein
MTEAAPEWIICAEQRYAIFPVSADRIRRYACRVSSETNLARLPAVATGDQVRRLDASSCQVTCSPWVTGLAKSFVMRVSWRQVAEYAGSVAGDGLEGAGDLGYAAEVEQADGESAAWP